MGFFPKNQSRGFTLLELVVVMVVILVTTAGGAVLARHWYQQRAAVEAGEELRQVWRAQREWIIANLDNASAMTALNQAMASGDSSDANPLSLANLRGEGFLKTRTPRLQVLADRGFPVDCAQVPPTLPEAALRAAGYYVGDEDDADSIRKWDDMTTGDGYYDVGRTVYNKP